MLHGRNGYTDETQELEHFRTAVKKLVVELPEVMLKLGATAIAVRGKSGVSIAHALAMYLNFDLIIVRKEGESNHGANIERWGTQRQNERYIIIDDFVSTGETCIEIINKLCPSTIYNSLCVGVVTYRGASYQGRVLKEEGFLWPSTFQSEIDTKIVGKQILVFSYEDNVAVKSK